MGIIISLAAFILIILAIYMLFKNQKTRRIGIKTSAKVVDLIDYNNNNSIDSVSHYFPVVQFTDQSGNEITKKLNRSDPTVDIGDTIQIVYLKKGKDYYVLIDSKLHRSCLPMALIIFLFSGLGFVAIALIIILLFF